MFRSLINWVYIGERWGSSCIFYLWRSSSAWCDETLSSSLCFWHLCKDPGGCTCVAYFWVLCSPPVICMCMVLPTPCCFYYRGPVVSPEVKLGILAAPFGFFSHCFPQSVPHINFRITFVPKKMFLGFWCKFHRLSKSFLGIAVFMTLILKLHKHSRSFISPMSSLIYSFGVLQFAL